MRFPTLYGSAASSGKTVRPGPAVAPDRSEATPGARPSGATRGITVERYRTGLGRGLDSTSGAPPVRGVLPAAKPGGGSVRGPGKTTTAPRPSSANPVRYGAGPVLRTKYPNGRPGKAAAGSLSPGRPASPSPGARPLSPADVRTTTQVISKLDPKTARPIRVGGQIASTASGIALGAAVGVLGGIRPSAFRGPGSYSPASYYGSTFGYYGYGNGLCFQIGYGSYFGGYYNPCSWTWWPYYLSCYSPYWYLRYRPYSIFRYGCGVPGFYSSVIYRDRVETETRVVYVSSEPVGEAHAGGSLSSVAQRYLTLGDRAFRESRYTDAVQFYAKAIEYAPEEGALHLVLSDALFAAGDYHYGAYALRRAIELEPALVSVPVDKHGFYPDPSLFDAQLAALEGYVARHPTDRDARLVLAMNYLFGGRSEEARRLLEDPASATLAEDAAAQAILATARGES